MSPRVDELAGLIEKHNDLYTNAKPEITDAEYDLLVEELRQLCPTHNVLKVVGSPVNSNYGKLIKHDIVMGSLDKVYMLRNNEGEPLPGESALSDLLKWKIDVSGKLVNVPKYLWSYKIDGVAGELVFVNGKLVEASGRGDGYEGLDWTEHVRHNPLIPTVITVRNKVQIRGEFYIPYSFFRQNLSGEANPRNSVAGAMNSVDPNVSKRKGVSFLVYGVIIDGERLSPSEAEKFVNSLICHHGVDQVNLTFNKLNEFNFTRSEINQIQSAIPSLDYMVDGIVITIDDKKDLDNLGYNGMCPVGAVAFKFPPEQAVATITNIIWNPSAIGRITPVAKFTPVKLGGTTVTQATLNNISYIKDMNVAIGDKVVVEKAGEIIPQIMRVTERVEDRNFNIPDTCPSCAHDTVVEGLQLMCVNPDCGAKTLGNIMTWIDATKMESVKQYMVEGLLSKGLIRDASDLYALTVDEISTVPRMSPQMAENVYNCIQSRKSIDLVPFLEGIAIVGLGKAYYTTIAEKFLSLNKLVDVSGSESKVLIVNNDLEGLKLFGGIIIERFISGLEYRLPLISDLLNNGVTVNDYKVVTGGPLSGKSFCFTGTLSKNRKLFEDEVVNLGGKLASVSRKLNYLVVGEDAGSKLSKAKECNVVILTENDYVVLVDELTTQYIGG